MKSTSPLMNARIYEGLDFDGEKAPLADLLLMAATRTEMEVAEYCMHGMKRLTAEQQDRLLYFLNTFYGTSGSTNKPKRSQ